MLVEYCFFESNHGHSVCDAVAAHAKNQVNTIQRNEGERITTPQGVVQTVNALLSHIAMIAPPNGQLPKFPTFHEITKGFKFRFGWGNRKVYMFSSGESMMPTKEFNIPEINF